MLCAVCPNPTTIVIAGTSTVVCVWDVSFNKDKLTHMKLRQVGLLTCLFEIYLSECIFHSHKHKPVFSSQPLYGHTDSVTCLAVSEVHSLIVSGSRDLTCILWDMEELSYITQLAGHTTSISALAINDLTVSPPSGSLFVVIYNWHSSQNLSYFCSLSFFLTVAMFLPVNLLTAWGKENSHCWQHACPVCMCFAFLGFSLCTSAHMGVNTLSLCYLRVRLRPVRDLSSTCGTWRASCWPALTLPAGLSQTSCVSASHSDTSGTPRMLLSLAVQMASYGWVFFMYVYTNVIVSVCTGTAGPPKKSSEWAPPKCALLFPT